MIGYDSWAPSGAQFKLNSVYSRSNSMSFSVYRFINHGEREVLGRYETRDAANAAHEFYCNKYPHAWVEVDEIKKVADKVQTTL